MSTSIPELHVLLTWTNGLYIPRRSHTSRYWTKFRRSRTYGIHIVVISAQHQRVQQCLPYYSKALRTRPVHVMATQANTPPSKNRGRPHRLRTSALECYRIWRQAIIWVEPCTIGESCRAAIRLSTPPTIRQCGPHSARHSAHGCVRIQIPYVEHARSYRKRVNVRYLLTLVKDFHVCSDAVEPCNQSRLRVNSRTGLREVSGYLMEVMVPVQKYVT
jgi:hypothetical protein